MSTYHKVQADEYVYPTIKGRYKMACCDCGLVHYLKFEVVKVLDESSPVEQDEIVTDPQYRVRLQAYRNNRATAQMRRHIRHTNRRIMRTKAGAYHEAFMESWLYGSNPIRRRVKGWSRLHNEPIAKSEL